MKKRNILILGASYGSLLATKLVMAGHRVSLVCTRANRRADQPRRHRGALPDARPRAAARDPLAASAGRDHRAQPRSTPILRDYDLVVLGMQEAQYGATACAS